MAGAAPLSSSLLRLPRHQPLLPRKASTPPSPPRYRFSTTLRASSAADSSAPVAVAVAGSAEVVEGFYDGVNRRDLGFVEQLIAEDCVYEDLVFADPIVGRKAILEFFKKFTECVSSDLQFTIDDISKEDSQCVGVTWHLEWKGRPFPFSKGCSFYRLDIRNQMRQIVYARDIVEPAIKPGDAALVIIRGVTWLLERFPQLAERL